MARERKAHAGTFWWLLPALRSCSILFGWFAPVPCGDISPGHIIISPFRKGRTAQDRRQRSQRHLVPDLQRAARELAGGLSPTLAVAPGVISAPSCFFRSVSFFFPSSPRSRQTCALPRASIRSSQGSPLPGGRAYHMYLGRHVGRRLGNCRGAGLLV